MTHDVSRPLFDEASLDEALLNDASGGTGSGLTPDAFVSHSSRDKALFVRPLVECLEEQGLSLWYDEYSMRPGDSLSASIDKGLTEANSGIVVISPAFIETAQASGWTHYELRGIVSNSVGRQGRRILPVWLDVTRDDVLGWSPSIADLLAVDASNKSIEEVALDLLRVLAPNRAGGLARMRLLSAGHGKGTVTKAKLDDLAIAPAIDRRVPGNVPLRALLVTLAIADCGVEHAGDLSGFLEDLSRDLHHEHELRIWEALAATYAWAVREFKPNEQRREALYHFLLGLTLGQVKEATVETLTSEVAESALAFFQELSPLLDRDAVIGAGGLRGYISESAGRRPEDEF